MIIHFASHETMNSTLSFLGMAFFILNEYRLRSVWYLVPLYSAYISLLKCVRPHMSGNRRSCLSGDIKSRPLRSRQRSLQKERLTINSQAKN